MRGSDGSINSLEKYTLYVLRRLIEGGVDRQTMLDLLNYLERVKEKLDVNEYRTILYNILRLADKYEDKQRDPELLAEKYKNEPKILDAIIGSLVEVENFKEDAEALLRDDVEEIIRDSWTIFKGEDKKEFVQHMISLFIHECNEDFSSCPGGLDNIMKEIKRNYGLRVIFPYAEGRGIIASLIEAREKGLLSENKVKKYGDRMANLVNRIYRILYDHPFYGVDKIFVETVLGKITCAVRNSLEKGSFKELDKVLDELDTMYSSENLEYLGKLRRRLGPIPELLFGLAEIDDPLVFKEIIRLLDKDEFTAMMRNLLLVGGKVGERYAVKSAIDIIKRSLIDEMEARKYLKACIESNDPNSCEKAKFFYVEIPKTIPEEYAIEEAVKRLVNTFGKRPYFPDLVNNFVEDLTITINRHNRNDLRYLRPGEMKLYIEVLTSSSFVELLDRLYRERGSKGIEEVREYLFPYIRFFIRKLKGDGSRIANRLVEVLKDYVSLGKKDILYGIIPYNSEVLEIIGDDKENLEKYLTHLDNLLKEYIIGKGVDSRVVFGILHKIISDRGDISKTLDKYFSPKAIEEIEREIKDRYF